MPDWTSLFVSFFPSFLAEDDGFILIGEDLALDVFADSTGEDYLLEVLAFEYEALGGVLMADACYVLLDDRTGIELCSDIVAGGTDDLHTAFPRLVIGFGAYEGGEERVVDIDDVVRIVGYHIVGDNLHVTRQHDEGYLIVFQ